MVSVPDMGERTSISNSNVQKRLTSGGLRAAHVRTACETKSAFNAQGTYVGRH